jgi:HK97 gp10 family phage protein
MQRLGADFIPVARAATLAGARVFQKEAKRGAPKRTGRLQQAIVVKRARSVPRGAVQYIVGVRSGRRGAKREAQAQGRTVSVNLDAFYWRFLEGGWVPRGPKNTLRGGRRTKALQARRARESGGRS